ncbi:hypothetical protein HHK36_006583 [Tetracentron sinense]|uniref:Uncharacterized protein n=1 Tax=Tetracentron sinense TaxID=13715 RepID=A0A834ZHG0_TETSI|nr:hypothetical protein HHK36_006583 [Tetracentron sinense]
MRLWNVEMRKGQKAIYLVDIDMNLSLSRRGPSFNTDELGFSLFLALRFAENADDLKLCNKGFRFPHCSKNSARNLFKHSFWVFQLVVSAENLFNRLEQQMGFLRNLAVLLPLFWIVWSLALRAQSPRASNKPARILDSLLQDYAYRALVHPKTGISYAGNVPSNLTGIKVSAMRLRSGSLRRRGVLSYQEFTISPGIIVEPYVERLVLVYQNLGNWSLHYYPLSGNYTYLAPVLGLLAYDGSNLSATNLCELNLRGLNRSISIKFPDVKSVPNVSRAMCVGFGLRGSVEFRSVLEGNICSTDLLQGHFSIVIESTEPVLVPMHHTPSNQGKDKWDTVVYVLAALFGGALLLLLLWAWLEMNGQPMFRNTGRRSATVAHHDGIPAG